MEAKALGYGGQSIVAKATGLSRTTLHREGLEKGQELPVSRLGRIRKLGGGRKAMATQDPQVLSASYSTR
ncbi:MAG: hypothetical protein ACRESZ_19465 [Methylococcales bacterium]